MSRDNSPKTIPRLLPLDSRISHDVITVPGDGLVIGKNEALISRYASTNPLEVNCISRRHATVVIQDGQCVLSDLGSTNGTLLNGEPLQANQAQVLNHGDILVFGHQFFSYQLEFEQNQLAAAPAPEPPAPEPPAPATCARTTCARTTCARTTCARTTCARTTCARTTGT